MRYVQGIIVNKDKILHSYGNNNRNMEVEFFIRGEIKNGETAEEAIKREVKEQVNITLDCVLKLNTEYSADTTTFFSDLGGTEYLCTKEGSISNKNNAKNINLNIENIKIDKNIWNVNLEGFRWVSLNNSEVFEVFNEVEISYLKKAYEQCLQTGYKMEDETALQNFYLANTRYDYEKARVLNLKRLNECKTIDNEVTYKEKLGAICAALLIGIIFKVFFEGKNLGISSLIFTSLFLAFFFWVSRKKVDFKLSMGWAFLVANLLVATNISIYSNVYLRILNVLMLPILGITSTLLLCNSKLKWHKFSFITVALRKITDLTFENCTKPFIFIKEIYIEREKRKSNKTKENIIIGLLVSIPILFIIFPLLASADMIFNFYIANSFSFIKHINVAHTIFSLILITSVFIYTFGYVWGFKYSHNESKKNKSKPIKVEAVTVLTIIFVINIVYLVFTIIQFSYLYSGSSIPNGYSYSNYARKGFFELVAVTVINFQILIFSMKFMTKENDTLNKIANLFLSLLIVFTINMLFSAHYKMNLYEATFGYTQLRVFVHIFMLLLFVLLLIAFAGIWLKKVPIGKASIITTLVMFIVLNYVNVDAYIAKNNIQIYKQTNEIDIEYLTTLSYDALPYIKELKDDSNIGVSRVVKNYLESKRKELSVNQSWFEFNLSRYKACKELNNIK